MCQNLFYFNLEENSNKLYFFEKSLQEGLISDFDDYTLKNLRKIYYSFYSAILYLYGEPTNFYTIITKVEILALAFQNKNYRVVYGYTNSTRQINFLKYSNNYLDYNSWIEVEIDGKEYVYDLFSMMRFEKDVFYKIENPDIFKSLSKKRIELQMSKYVSDYLRPRDIWMLVDFIPEFEKKIENLSNKDILLLELERYKKEIDYEKVVLEWNGTKRKKYIKKN